MANHSDRESCGAHREVCVEALTGETGRPAIEPRNDQFGMPTLLIVCASLTVVDGDTVNATGRTCGCWGKAFRLGIDTPEIGDTRSQQQASDR